MLAALPPRWHGEAGQRGPCGQRHAFSYTYVQVQRCVRGMINRASSCIVQCLLAGAASCLLQHTNPLTNCLPCPTTPL